MDYKKIPKASGIYKITNTVNGKVYVGLAIDLRNRCRCHEKDLRLQKHRNEHLQKAYNLYGSCSFEFEVLQICTKDSLVKNEDYWCKFYNSHNKNIGYNIRGTGDDIHRWSQESKAKMGNKIINTSTGIIYDTIKDASDSIKMVEQTLGKMLNGKRTNRTTFQYLDKNLQKEKFVKKNYKQVIDIKTGQIFNSIKDVCLLTGIPHSTLSHKLTGIRKNSTNYKFYK
jgi:group I intron endonuclease